MALMAATSMTVQAEAVYDFALPAAPLANTLIQIGQQSQHQVLFIPSDVAQRQAVAVQGRLSATDAVRQALRGTGLAVQITASGALSVQPATTRAVTLDTTTINSTGASDGASTGVNGYVAQRSESGTKSDTPLIKTPQAISVVTREQMDVQNVQSVAQALRYTSGINPEVRGTNTDSLEYLYARGFQVEEYLNGLRLPGSIAGFNITSFDPYMLERIELLHGPASVLYGQGSPGGAVNLTSKMPTAEPLHEVGVQTGNHGRTQAFFDFSGPLDDDGKLLYRLTADGFDTSTQTDHVREQRVAISPTLTWQPTLDTKLTVFANYQRDPEAGNYNFVPAIGTVQSGPVSLPRALDPGEPSYDSFSKTQDSIGYSLEHSFDDTWSFKQNYRFLHNSQTVKYVGYYALSADNTSLLRTPYMNTGTVNSHTLDNQLTAKFDTGPVSHQVTAGLDFQHVQYDHSFYGSDFDAAPLSIANPQYGQPVPATDFEFGTSGAETMKQTGVYLQDQVSVDKWSFLAGLRQDWTKDQFDPYTAGGDATRQSNHAFTWRLGGVYQFENGIAPYASYSQSFQPNIGTDFFGKPFTPTTGEQYEVGVKFQPKDYNSFITVAAFHLDQDNVSTADPQHPNFSVQTGQVRSQGVEVEGHASLSNNLQLIASYTYTDLLNTKSNTGNQNKVPVGIPRNTASLWADYTLSQGPLDGLQLGGGARYVAGSYGDALNTFQTPAVTLLDAALHYKLDKALPGLKGWTASLNASNLADKHYISSCSDGFCNWGQGRVMLAGLKYQW